MAGTRGSVLDAETLNVLKPKEYLLRRDQNASGQSIWLFIAYWDTLRKGATPHSPRNCLPGSGWEPLEVSMVTDSPPPTFHADHGEQVPDTEGSGSAAGALLVPISGESDSRRGGGSGAVGEELDREASDRWRNRASFKPGVRQRTGHLALSGPFRPCTLLWATTCLTEEGPRPSSATRPASRCVLLRPPDLFHDRVRRGHRALGGQIS